MYVENPTTNWYVIIKVKKFQGLKINVGNFNKKNLIQKKYTEWHNCATVDCWLKKIENVNAKKESHWKCKMRY